ncbi:MAG TPA: glycosyltransferase family 4 protein [Flavobacteriales bacterium]|nr:glycosyltransferase family 4 protein [Flavobacteriales bacterium]HNU55353.1 glycosyltransferase family 4 protein [Flavobacteriales bacterium]
MKPLHVLYLTHYADLYGANRSLLDLVVGLRDAGAVRPFVVAAADGPLIEELRRCGIAHAMVPFASWMHKQVYSGRVHHRFMQRLRFRRAARMREQLNAEAIRRIDVLAREHAVELVHTNSAVIGIGGALAHGLRVPHIWHIRELPFLHYRFKVDGGVRRYARELRKADAVIALSQAVVDDMRQWMPLGERVRIIPNGIITVEQWKQREWMVADRWNGDGTFAFMLAGYFHASKGQLEAVRAFAAVHAGLPFTRLHLVGDGQMAPVRELVHALGLDGVVTLHGFVKDIRGVMDHTHAVLQCSRYEALGRITLEAMADGLPVIGHASGATPELVIDGTSGRLYRTHEELVEAMRRLAMDRDLAMNMGRAGRQRVLDGFTLDRMLDGTRRIYRDLVPS